MPDRRTWFLTALLLAAIIFASTARGQDDHQDLLKYIAASAHQQAESISKLREDVAALKTSEESNTVMLRWVIGGIVSGAIGLAWGKLKGKLG